MATRSAEEVFAHHGQALGAESLEEIVSDYAEDVLYLEWRASGGGRKIEDGIDTFVFRDGMIRVQTVVYTVQPA